MCILSDVDERCREKRLWMCESGVGSRAQRTYELEFSNLDANRVLEGDINALMRQV